MIKFKSTVLLASTLLATVSATTSHAQSFIMCGWDNFNVYVANTDVTVTNPTGPTVHVVSEAPWTVGGSCFDNAWPGLAEHLAFIQGMERYAEEYDDWAEAHEKMEDMLYVKDQNTNLTDDAAWVYLDGSRISFDTNNDGTDDYFLRNRSITKGADTDNNGLIDVLERTGTYTSLGNDLYYGQY